MSDADDHPRDEHDSDEAENDARIEEVEGDEGMPGEVLDTPQNEPGDQRPPPA